MKFDMVFDQVRTSLGEVISFLGRLVLHLFRQSVTNKYSWFYYLISILFIPLLYFFEDEQGRVQMYHSPTVVFFFFAGWFLIATDALNFIKKETKRLEEENASL